ncbi:MAG: hypothetical protein JWL84_594, partial [Rhodospirillales bacterium]|nr:hypothetical protein [Rhodospirillales bacterium]
IIVGDRKVSMQFTNFPQAAHDRLLERITSLTSRLEAMVLAAEPVKTGRLRSTTKSTVYDSPKRIAGVVTVSADFAKGAALEYGSHTTISVNETSPQARARQSKSKIPDMLTAPFAAVASKYQRTTNLTAMRFLRGPLAEISDEAVDEMRFAVEQAAGQAA